MTLFFSHIKPDANNSPSKLNRFHLRTGDRPWSARFSHQRRPEQGFNDVRNVLKTCHHVNCQMEKKTWRLKSCDILSGPDLVKCKLSKLTLVLMFVLMGAGASKAPLFAMCLCAVHPEMPMLIFPCVYSVLDKSKHETP